MASFRLAAHVFLSRLADLVFPPVCGGCRSPGALLCAACRPLGPPVDVSIRAVPVPCFAAGSYQDALRRALLAYKERGRRELAEPLGALLAEALALCRPRGAVLVGVPSARSAARVRGGDHVLRLARAAAQLAHVEVVPALSLSRRVMDSAALAPAERRTNLDGAMRAQFADGRPAVVVDDIATTGATLREAVRALHEAGWQVVGAAIVAATPRRESRTGAAFP